MITVSALADFNGKPGGGAPPTCRTDVDDRIADFSNVGSLKWTWFAPGVDIESGVGCPTTPPPSTAAPRWRPRTWPARWRCTTSTHPGSTPAQTKSALQSAGTLDWNDADDPDPIKERLLNVSGF